HHVMSKFFCGCKFERKIFPRAQASVNRQQDGQGNGRFAAEHGDGLRLSIFEYLEVFFVKPADGSAVRIRDRGENIHQLHFYMDSIRRFRFLREDGDADKKQQNQNRCSFHLGLLRLDAAATLEISWPPRISSGKDSPSAQTAPSSKYSFFQMGTVFLSVSINQRLASNAAARCADATTINTLVSPISRRPRRCSSHTSRTWNFSKASRASACIFFSAISS